MCRSRGCCGCPVRDCGVWQHKWRLVGRFMKTDLGGRAERFVDWTGVGKVGRMMGKREESRITSKLLTWTNRWIGYPTLKWERLKEEEVWSLMKRRKNEEFERKERFLGFGLNNLLNIHSSPIKLFLFFTRGNWNSGKLNNTSKDTEQGSARTWIWASMSDSRIHTCSSTHHHLLVQKDWDLGTAFVSMSFSFPIYKTRQIILTA